MERYKVQFTLGKTLPMTTYSGKKGSNIAKLVFGMNQSLDGYVDHRAFAPNSVLFRHFVEEAQGEVGSVYCRHMYEVMRYWDDDHPINPYLGLLLGFVMRFGLTAFLFQ